MKNIKKKQPPKVFCKKVFLKLSQNSHENVCVGVSFFNKVGGFRTVTLLEKKLRHRCFSVKCVNFLRTPILQNIYEWLPLNKHPYLTL